MKRSTRLLALVVLALAAFTAMAAGRPLAPRPLAPAFWEMSSPRSAYAGGRFLTVWYQNMRLLGPTLMGAFSNADGTRLSERAFPLDIGTVLSEGSYDVLGHGDSFVLLWRDADGKMNVADVDRTGQLANRRTFVLPSHSLGKFAWNGTYFAGVLPSQDSSIVMFDRDGTIVVPPAPLRHFPARVDFVVAGDRFIALTSGSEAVVAREITPAGAGEEIYVDFAAGSPLSGYQPTGVVALPAGNGDVLVVWGTSSAGLGQLKSAIIRADGTRTAEVLLATGTGTGTGRTVPREMLRTSGGYAVVFTDDQGLHRVRLDAAGARDGDPELVSGSVRYAVGDAAAGPDTILVPFDPRIATVAVRATGVAGAPELLSIGPSRQMQPVLGAGSGEVFATWTEVAGETDRVRGTPVDADGNPGAPVDLGMSSLASTETAWNGTHHLVVHRVDKRLLATRVDADGSPEDVPPLTLAELRDHRAEAGVIWTGTRWVVVWTDFRQLWSAVISRSGSVSHRGVLDVRPAPVNGKLHFPRRPALASDGTRVLLVWTEGEFCYATCVPIPPKTYATRLTRTGVTDDRVRVDLGIEGEPSLSAASSGSEFLVLAGPEAFVLDDVQGELRVTATRELLDWPATSDVTWSGGNYVAALRYGAGTWYLGVLRLDRDGSDAAMRRAAPTLTPSEEAAPSIAAPFAGDALIGVQEGTFADGVSATVYRERDLEPMPAPPGPPRNVRVRHVSEEESDVTWDAPAEGHVDSYVIEQLRTDGRWVTTRVKPAGTRRVRVYTGSGSFPVRVRAFNAGGPSAPAEQGPERPRRRAVR